MSNLAEAELYAMDTSHDGPAPPPSGPAPSTPRALRERVERLLEARRWRQVDLARRLADFRPSCSFAGAQSAVSHTLKERRPLSWLPAALDAIEQLPASDEPSIVGPSPETTAPPAELQSEADHPVGGDEGESAAETTADPEPAAEPAPATADGGAVEGAPDPRCDELGCTRPRYPGSRFCAEDKARASIAEGELVPRGPGGLGGPGFHRSPDDCPHDDVVDEQCMRCGDWRGDRSLHPNPIVAEREADRWREAVAELRAHTGELMADVVAALDQRFVELEHAVGIDPDEVSLQDQLHRLHQLGTVVHERLNRLDSVTSGLGQELDAVVRGANETSLRVAGIEHQAGALAVRVARVDSEHQQTSSWSLKAQLQIGVSDPADGSLQAQINALAHAFSALQDRVVLEFHTDRDVKPANPPDTSAELAAIARFAIKVCDRDPLTEPHSIRERARVIEWLSQLDMPKAGWLAAQIADGAHLAAKDRRST